MTRRRHDEHQPPPERQRVPKASPNNLSAPCSSSVSGNTAFEVDGVTVEAEPGSSVVAPPGRPHLAWNPTNRPVRLRIEMRPALRWAEFVRRLFDGEDAVGLLDEFRDEIVLAPKHA